MRRRGAGRRRQPFCVQSQQSLATCVGIHHHGLLCFSRSLGVGGAEVQLAAAAALPLARWQPVPCAGCVALCWLVINSESGKEEEEVKLTRRSSPSLCLGFFFCRTPPALFFARSATFVAVRSLSLLRSLASLLVVVAVDDGRVWLWHGIFSSGGFLD